MSAMRGSAGGSHAQSAIDPCAGRVHEHPLRGLNRPRADRCGTRHPDPKRRVDSWSACRASGEHEELPGGAGASALTAWGLLSRQADIGRTCGSTMLASLLASADEMDQRCLIVRAGATAAGAVACLDSLPGRFATLAGVRGRRAAQNDSTASVTAALISA